MRERIASERLVELQSVAEDALQGRILLFSRWKADFGMPIDWHIHPQTRLRWNPDSYWSKSLSGGSRVGDIKLTWEVARFPQVYHLARYAAFFPEAREELYEEVAGQVGSFATENQFGYGVHWNSGQEIAFRLLAWLFGLQILGKGGDRDSEMHHQISRQLYLGALQIEAHIDYARFAVHNNHLLSEALGLMVAGLLLPDQARAPRWRDYGWELLDEAADRQFYEDGGYIQQSHNYHRVALQDLLWAASFARAAGLKPSSKWLEAMGRSVDFLVPQQNPDDGRLPNYGSNDGALPGIFSTCDYSDFRPTLQAASLAARGERLYEPGPWDEEAAWLLGPGSLDAPVVKKNRSSVAFWGTGFHVMRGKDESSFGVLRCGSIRDRFSQIDMLHLDVWWKGQNVLIDGGSYLYNGPTAWHNYFVRTASHNTVTVAGRDQMLHYRKFKNLYWTETKLLRFEQKAGVVLAEGEHYGYRRLLGEPVHRRSVLLVGEDLWVVVDWVRSGQPHPARLHWLGGEYPHRSRCAGAELLLDTPKGPFTIQVLDLEARPMQSTIVAGQEEPPRGWHSRYYGERRPTPSLAVELPPSKDHCWISLLGANQPRIRRNRGMYVVENDRVSANFTLEDGSMSVVSVSKNGAESP